MASDLGCHNVVTLWTVYGRWALTVEGTGIKNFETDLFVSINRTTKRTTVRIRQRIQNLLSIVRNLCLQRERILLPCTLTTDKVCVRG